MSLGSLVVNLSASTAQFNSAMDKAAYTSAKRMEQMRKSANMVGAAIGAAFVAGVGAASVLVKQAIDSADAMSKMAQKAGIAVESLSTLAFAAQLSDVDVGTLQMSMVKLAKGMSDATMGTGEAMKGFDALGINVKDAAGNLKSSDSIMSEVAAKFAGMEDGANKTALAVSIFGRSGADLIPMLNSGADGLKEMQDEARALGLELDGSTSKAAELFNDNLTRLNTVKNGFANQIMKAMLPALNGMTNSMVESAKSAGGMEKAARAAAAGIKILMSVGAIVVGVFKTLGETLGGVAAVIMQLFQGEFKQAFETGKNVVTDFTSNIKGTLGTVETIWDESAKKVEAGSSKTGAKIAAPMMVAAQKAKQSREKIVSEVDKANEAVEKMIDNLAFQADTFGKSEKGVDDWKLGLMHATQAQRDQVAVMHDYITGKKKEADITAESARLFEETRTPMEQYAAKVERLNELVQAGALGWDTYDRAVKMAQDNLDKTTKAGEDGMANLQKAVEGWGNKFTDTFVDGVMKGKLSFKDLANSIISDILRIIVQKQVLNAIGDFGEGGKGGTGILGSIAGFMFSGGKAAGGPVKPGNSYLIGERGPETFTPSQSGTITPAPSSAQVTVIQNFTVGDVASISMVRQAVAGSEKRIAGAMGRSMQYGGALS